MEITFDQLPKVIARLSDEVSEIKRLLLERSNKSNYDPEKLLTIQEAGEFLNLSVPTLYSKVQKAEIPVNKQGNRLYFSKLELLQWVKSGRKMTRQEMADNAEKFLAEKKGGNHERQSKALRRDEST